MAILSRWPLLGKVFLPILEVVQVVKQPWRHQVYLQACMSRTYCVTPKAVLASVQHSVNSVHTGTSLLVSVVQEQIATGYPMQACFGQTLLLQACRLHTMHCHMTSLHLLPVFQLIL